MSITPEEELRRAGEARQVIDAPVFQAARADFYRKLEQARRSAPLAAVELHTKLILMEQVADQFFGYFDQLAQTGRMAEDFLADQQRQRGIRERAIQMWQHLGRGAL